MSWSDLPVDQPDPIWIAWQSNHQTGKDYPTDPWRGAMSLPRGLFLFVEEGRMRLGQKPLAAIADLRGEGMVQGPRMLTQGEAVELLIPGDSFMHKIALSDYASASVAVTLADDEVALTTLKIDFAARSLRFERHASPLCPDARFACSTLTQMHVEGAIGLEIYFDGSLLEIFADGGRRVWSACLFPRGALRVEVCALSGSARVDRFEGWAMASTITGKKF